MHLKKLVAVNVFKYDDITINFDNKTHLIMANINGDYEKSNGVGKSAIIELILYCLFQKTLRGETDISKYHSGKYSIELEFDNIKVHRTQTKLDIYVDGVKTDRKKSDAQSFINNLIKFDMDMLSYTNIFTPDRNFFKLSDTDKKDVLMKLINLDWIDDVYEQVKDESDTLREKKLDNIIEIYENEVKNIDKARKDEEIVRKKLTEIMSYEQGIKDYQQYQKDLKGLYERYKEVWDENNELKTSIKGLMTKLKDVVLEDATDLTSKISDGKAMVKGNKQSIIELEQKNNVLKTGKGKCPTCEQDLPDESKEKIININLVKIKEFNDNIKNTTEQINKYQDKLDMAIRLKQKNDQDNAQLTGDKQRYTKNKDNMKVMRTNIIKKVKDNVGLYQYKNINISLQDIRSAQLEHANTLALVQQLVKKQKQIEEYKVENDKIHNRIKDLDIMKKLFGKDGLKQYAIGKIMGYLEDEINNMLQNIFPDMSIKFYTNLNVDKRNMLKIKIIRCGNEVDFSEFSAGEKRIMEVLFQIGLYNLFKVFSNQEFNVFSFDEVLDPLDVNNSGIMVDIIKMLENENKTIFVISHKEHIQQLFENKIIINSDGKNSWI